MGLLTKIRRDEQRIGEEIMSGETADWLDSYYEALEFFYWEPQHFRANTNAAAEVKKLDEIAKKSTRAEQVTNHLAVPDTAPDRPSQITCVERGNLVGIMSQ